MLGNIKFNLKRNHIHIYIHLRNQYFLLICTFFFNQAIIQNTEDFCNLMIANIVIDFVFKIIKLQLFLQIKIFASKDYK